MEFIPEHRQETVRKAMLSAEEKRYTAEGRRSDGATFPFEAQSRQLEWHGKTVRVVSIRDLSRQTQLETHVRLVQDENVRLRAELSEKDRLGALRGGSPLMRKTYERILQAAETNETVIIYGETGTGKELAARAIFEMSRQYAKMFVPVNCGAIQESLFETAFFGSRKGAFTGAERTTPGYLERAEGGTLFLDEIGELSLTMQAKLLRVLNDKSYTRVGEQLPRKADLRIIAATNRNLRGLVAQGLIREDFFHRLHVIALSMPPLRLHASDIPELVAHFLRESDGAGRTPPVLPPELLRQFMAYEWPGNVRELFNELRRWLITGTVELQGKSASPTSDHAILDLSEDGGSFSEQIGSLERSLLSRALQQSGGNKKEAALLLKMPLITLHRKVKKYGITDEEASS